MYYHRINQHPASAQTDKILHTKTASWIHVWQPWLHCCSWALGHIAGYHRQGVCLL